ncbi:hypothetical protein O181_033436 [Austropuccinia psidii MF-1]|uniref:Uncharacterized protein n=1 Tax=Austropuccinia psidii MF-1 TaxID=1389203 RepID=A0A9Q3H735_9BASI|nr:hypothetical protein [Austropuccinia psidii MF-1]
MPLQHSPPTKNTRAQRNQAVLTPTERAPLDCTPSVHQLSDTLDRGPPMEGEAPSRRGGRKKEKGGHQEKKPQVTGSNPSRPPQDSSSKRPHHKKSKKGKNFQVSKDKPHATILNKDNKSIHSEKKRRIKEGLCTYCGGKYPIEKCFKRPQNRPGSSRGSLSSREKCDWES